MEKNKIIYRKDYKKPNYLISEINLKFDIIENLIIVKSLMKVVRNSKVSKGTPFILNGEEIKLISIRMNNKTLSKEDWIVDKLFLTINQVDAEFELEIETEINPNENKAFAGIYKSGNIICSQNEPEGFRRITYFPDRPDVMTKFNVEICADKDKYPMLLSNGNKLETKDLGNNIRTVSWQDPFPKPAYLFALVAGDFDFIQDVFITKSGKQVDLIIYVDKGNAPRATFAMQSLKKAMKWDEDIYGLEYDLELYQIVAVDTFNFGAMENKGLNIFNSKYVLASAESATDNDYQGIEGVIAHEYFHNWTGNRITCRDWFQLTLKEGLTVFRDQEFSSDMNSRDEFRISEVKILRDMQFQEDAGPISHPIRPDSYIEIDNFYTSTVYNKGAEVIRMIQTLIGKETFQLGMKKYFELFDGQAVQCDDFIHAMELASGKDLTQFKNWYSQNGTPCCKIIDTYDEKMKTYSLEITQKINEGQEIFYYPLKMGLIDENNNEILEKQLIINKSTESFTFNNIFSRPTPSFLRTFSAPIKIEYNYSQEMLFQLLQADTDIFNKYEAGQLLIKKAIFDIIKKVQDEKLICVAPKLLNSFENIIENKTLDDAIKALIITPPSLSNISNDMEICDFDAVFNAQEFFIKSFALRFEDMLLKKYNTLKSDKYKYSQIECGKRKLKNRILIYLGSLGNSYDNLIFEAFSQSDNMTDTIATLNILTSNNSKFKDKALEIFYSKWEKDSLTINKWFAIQSSAKYGNVLDNIKAIIKTEAFDEENPNKIRAIYHTFASNLTHFHNIDGSGYAFIANKIMKIDKLNSNLSAGLAKTFNKYSKLDTKRQALLKIQLNKIIDMKPISKGLYEIISKTLGI